MGSQQLCLKWSNHQNNMLDVFDNLLTKESFVDVSIACDGTILKAHKVILSACSSFFEEIFDATPCKHPVIIMRDINLKDLKAVIQFMYKGEVNVSEDQLSDLLKTAEALKIKGLTEYSSQRSPSLFKATIENSHNAIPGETHFNHNLNKANNPRKKKQKVTSSRENHNSQKPIQTSQTKKLRNQLQEEYGSCEDSLPEYTVDPKLLRHGFTSTLETELIPLSNHQLTPEKYSSMDEESYPSFQPSQSSITNTSSPNGQKNEYFIPKPGSVVDEPFVIQKFEPCDEADYKSNSPQDFSSVADFNSVDMNTVPNDRLLQETEPGKVADSVAGPSNTFREPVTDGMEGTSMNHKTASGSKNKSKRKERKPCPKCFKMLSKHNMSTHLRYVHGSREIRYQCHICLRSFTWKTTLYKHLYVDHKAPKEYHCSFCERKFDLGRLIHHLKKDHDIVATPEQCGI